MRHSLISGVAAILLLQGIWADVTGNDDREGHETLCSFPGYDVRYVSSDDVWASTTVFSQSVRSALSTAKERLLKYAAWNSMAGKSFHLSVPYVIQTFLPSAPDTEADFTFKREFTVSVPLPKELRDNPPMALDPLVVLDVVPDTLMYVRKFHHHKGGFIVDKEAKKFFQDLRDAGEPYWSDDDYFYVGQYPRGYTEMFIFASNERVDEFYRQSEGPEKARLRLPKCLRKTGITWAPNNKTDDVDMTRRSCRPDFCNHPACLDYTVLDTFKEGMERRRYVLLRTISTHAPTCHFQYTSALAQPVLNLHLKAAGVVNPSDEFRMMDQEARSVIQVKEGKGHCHKQFKSFAVVPNQSFQTKGSVVYEDYVKFPEKVRQEDVYLSNYYVKCFGGHGDSSTIFDMARRLGDRMVAKDCRLPNNFHVNEYNRQSRLFDRRNEIWYSDEACKPELKTWLQGFLSVPGSNSSVIDTAFGAGSPDWDVKEDVTITFDHDVDRSPRTLPRDVRKQLCRQHSCPPWSPVRRFDRFVEMYSWRPEDYSREDGSHRHKLTDPTKSPRRGGVECYFPFLYKGQLNYECVSEGFEQPWCAWDAVYTSGHWSYCDRATKELDGSIEVTNRQYSADLADPTSSVFTTVTSAFETQMESAVASVLGAELQSVAVRGFRNVTASGNLRVDFTLVVNSNSTHNSSAWSAVPEATESDSLAFESSSLTVEERVDTYELAEAERPSCTFPFLYKGEVYHECRQEFGIFCAWDTVASRGRWSSCGRDSWACSTEAACSYEAARAQATPLLQAYFDGKNDRGVKMNNTKPVLTIMTNSSAEEGSECGQSYSVCFWLPAANHRNPPEPNKEDEISIAQPIQQYFYSMVVEPLRDQEHLDSLVTSFQGYMDDLQRFGVSYVKGKHAVLDYGAEDGGSQYNEIVFFKKTE